MGRGLLPPGGGAWDGSLSLRPDSPVLPWSCALLQLIKFKISQHSPISAPEGPWVHFAFRVEVHPFLSGHPSPRPGILSLLLPFLFRSVFKLMF